MYQRVSASSSERLASMKLDPAHRGLERVLEVVDRRVTSGSQQHRSPEREHEPVGEQDLDAGGDTHEVREDREHAEEMELAGANRLAAEK